MSAAARPRPRACGGHHPADPGGAVRIAQHAQVRQRRAVVALDPQMAGLRFEVPAVQLRVGALLLDHEHVHAQPQQAVQGGGVELGEGRHPDGWLVHPPNGTAGTRRVVAWAPRAARSG